MRSSACLQFNNKIIIFLILIRQDDMHAYVPSECISMMLNYSCVLQGSWKLFLTCWTKCLAGLQCCYKYPFYPGLLAIYWRSHKIYGKHGLKMKNVKIWDKKTERKILALWGYEAEAFSKSRSWRRSRSFELCEFKPKAKQLRTHFCCLPA